MVLNLGGFKFNWKQVGGISLETEFGISSQDRIQNHPVLFAANLGNQTVSIEGQTMPYNGDKQTALKRLYALASGRQSYAIFTPNGAFFTQSFNIELRRDYD